MPSDLVGVAEVADILGLSRQRVSQLAVSDRLFPEPVARLAAGPVWTRESIDDWVRVSGREADDGPAES